MLTLTDSTRRTIERSTRSWSDGKKLERLDAVNKFVITAPIDQRRDHRGRNNARFDLADAGEAEQEFQLEKRIAEEQLYGHGDDDPGALAAYGKHRYIEQAMADFLHRSVLPWCLDRRDYLLHRELQTLSYKLLFCRRLGPFGINAEGKCVIAWHDKCGSTRFCPDEARHESLRLRDRYVPERSEAANGRTLLEHVARGGRVYKAVIAPRHYPGGRLREGMRYELKRFRDRALRAVRDRKKKYPIDGALVILEAPLSEARLWNVHLNVLLLTHGWLDYEAFQADFDCSIKIREVTRFDDVGIARLMNELFKYATLTVAEKSAERKSDAPPMIEWTPAEFVEWHRAHKGFRRTRAYGCFHGVGKPEHPYVPLPTRWIGMVEFTGQHGLTGYRLQWAETDYSAVSERLLTALIEGDLFLIRGDNSTTHNRQNGMRGPP